MSTELIIIIVVGTLISAVIVIIAVYKLCGQVIDICNECCHTSKPKQHSSSSTTLRRSNSDAVSDTSSTLTLVIAAPQVAIHANSAPVTHRYIPVHGRSEGEV